MAVSGLTTQGKHLFELLLYALLYSLVDKGIKVTCLYM